MNRKTFGQPYSIFAILFFLLIAVLFNGCVKPRTPIAEIFVRSTSNSVYKELNDDSLRIHLQRTLQANYNQFKNPRYLMGFYASADFQPILLKQFYPDSSVFYFINYLEKVKEHGFSLKDIGSRRLRKSVEDLSDKHVVTAIDEAYQQLVWTELLFAEALTNYSIALQYGVLHPMRVLPRYYIETKRPDSLSFHQVLSTDNLVRHLDSIQPDMPMYKMLQQALVGAEHKESSLGNEEQSVSDKMTLIANLERLRWKQERDSSWAVFVNIPAYHLSVVKDRKAIVSMKVVVGKAGGQETPVLRSLIQSVQVNPVWNIPASIASNEILAHAQTDKFYLRNNGIDVFYKGKKMEAADSIDWSGYDKEHLPFTFKQQPGRTNALGQIKFLFKNGSSVYLHDTPAKGAFGRATRAASHGCVRVEKPLVLAQAIFGEGAKYDTIAREMGRDDPHAKTIHLDPKVEVVLDYATSKLDEQGQLVFYPDIYKLDTIVYQALK
ncbi:L,D-transpeptidase family protein [Olivibacter sp. SDN3]|uniref:L,D-transpeptidase family protein n=1 Tax=Olivibacter sp. SDN3 TaxID=2764720 RepID=UPI0016511667|nr:L,D-transpeptidase family protein [Olivibacter sp. SDN3]QNL50709.1 L,D-transpeptidase family protein [Olivibacter sp. SDN3]